jgi:hypothetical protein
MSLLLKEYCGFKPVKDNGNTIELKEAAFNDLTTPATGTLMVEVEGIHSHPFSTGNFTRYMPEALKKSVPAWTHPYLKPLIKFHNDQNGRIIGRVYNAEYTEKTSVEGAGGLIFTIAVPDQEADKDVQNRLLETVSIGITATDVRCSVCGAQIEDEHEGCPNGHTLGSLYEGQYCFWDIYAFIPKEVSYVIIPSDPYAKNIRTYRIGDKGIQMAASDNGIKGIPLQEGSGGNSPTEMNIEELKKKLAEAEAKIKELEAKLAEKPEEDVEAIKAENEKLNKTIEEIKAELDKLKESSDADKKAVEDAKAAKASAEEEASKSKADVEILRKEKEDAEANGIKIQESYRNFVTDTLNSYRKILGKVELKEEELKDRAIDSLNDSIADLRNEIASLNKLDLKEDLHVPNPVLPPKDNKPKKTEHDYRQTDLTEGLESLLRHIV